MLEEEVGGFAGADGEVLLDFGAFFSAEGGIGEDDVVTILLLNVGEIFGEGVGVDDVGGFDAVEDHVHDSNYVGQGFLFFAGECAGLKNRKVLRG